MTAATATFPAWSDTAVRVLEERYLLRDENGKVIETPEEMCHRVAAAVAQAERKYGEKNTRAERVANWTKRFEELMRTHQFMPNSPTLMNAGKNNGLQLSACYVIPVPDSLEGIFEAIKHAALIHKSGGGTGMGFSRLRPKGSTVAATQGVSSGPVSFMKIFDAATEGIKQGGRRRGANMGVLNVSHPDILEFINCKRDGSVTNFNISVGITDEFMKALEDDTDYDLIDPHTGERTGQLRARDVLEQIVDAAWSTGDPGLIFIDRVNRSPANPTPSLESIEATNPCVIGSTRIATTSGLRRMDDLFASGEQIVVVTDMRVPGQKALVAAGSGSDVIAPTKVACHVAVPVFSTGVNKVYMLMTAHGHEITATAYHKFYTPRGYIPLSELSVGDTLYLQSGEGAWSNNWSLPEIRYGQRGASRLQAKIEHLEANPPTQWTKALGEVLGYIVGDGYVRRDTTSNVLGMAIAHGDVEIARAIQSRIREWFGADGNNISRQGHFQVAYKGVPADFFMSLGIEAKKATQKRVPESVFTAPREAVVGFLRGLFSADGTVNISCERGSCSIRLASSSKALLQDVQLLLANFGIVSKIHLRRAAGIKAMPNAQRDLTEYRISAQYELLIDKANRDRFMREIGFMQESKNAVANNWIATKKRESNTETFTTAIASIQDAGFAETYDTTEPVTHSIIVQGIVTAQCGEQPLGPYDACNLGSINLSLFVDESNGAQNPVVDWGALHDAVEVAVRFLDDVIDINPYPLSEVREKVLANRRIGLGVMGWAEMLFKLHVAYDSADAINLGKRVMTFIRTCADEASENLAKERGAFPNWEQSIYGPKTPQDNFGLTGVVPQRPGRPANEFPSIKLRNSNRTTVAPTGTISIIADCSSGIEPIFALAFQHRVKQPDGSYRVLDFVNPFFEAAVRAHYYGDTAEEIIGYAKAHGTLHGHWAYGDAWLKEFVTAHDISPDWHIQMQAAFQNGVDSAISKTVNLPNDATRADVARAYMLAYELGCQGITIFRDGCKGEQVLNLGVKKDEKPVASEPVEPVGAIKEQIRADRAARYHNGIKTRPAALYGYTRQVKSPEGKVNITLNSDDEGLFEVFVNVGRAGSDIAALAEAMGRLMSFALRLDSNIPPWERVAEMTRQLRGIGGSAPIGFGPNRVLSLPDAIAQALETHVSENKPIDAPTEVAPEPEVVTRRRLGNVCDKCGNSTVFLEEGCRKCYSCGDSKC